MALNLKPDDATRPLTPGGEHARGPARGAALARRRPDVLVPQPQQLRRGARLSRDMQRPARARSRSVGRARRGRGRLSRRSCPRRHAMRNTRIDSGSAAQAGSSPFLSALASREYGDRAPRRYRRRPRVMPSASARKRSLRQCRRGRVRRRVDAARCGRKRRGGARRPRRRARRRRQLSVDRERERADPFRVRQAVTLAARLEFRPRANASVRWTRGSSRCGSAAGAGRSSNSAAAAASDAGALAVDSRPVLSSTRSPPRALQSVSLRQCCSERNLFSRAACRRHWCDSWLCSVARDCSRSERRRRQKAPPLPQRRGRASVESRAVRRRCQAQRHCCQIHGAACSDSQRPQRYKTQRGTEQPLSGTATSQNQQTARRTTSQTKTQSASWPPQTNSRRATHETNTSKSMGQAASAELRTAQATISTLTKDLAAARSTLAATEATVQQAKSEAVVRGAQSVGSQFVDGVIARQALERELEEAKRIRSSTGGRTPSGHSKN